MRRRRLLAALVAGTASGLAGCLSRVTDPGDAAHPVRLSLADVDEVPAGVEVRLAADLLEPMATDDHPPRLAVTTTNTGSERSLSVGDGGCDLFNRGKGGSDDPPGLWLHRAGAVGTADRAGDRWVSDRDPDQPRGYDGYGCSWEPYAAGESVTTEYLVWQDYQVPGYFESGTYRWEERVRVAPGTGEERREDARAFDWGFALRVEE